MSKLDEITVAFVYIGFGAFLLSIAVGIFTVILHGGELKC